MTEPTVTHLVRDLADETSGWVQAEVVHLRREIEQRFEEVRYASVRLAVGLTVMALGLQLLFASLGVILRSWLGLGWPSALGAVGAGVLFLGALVAASARARRLP